MTVLLHGFWGQPMDWNPVVDRLPLAAPLWIPDLYLGPLGPDKDLEAWTLNFIEQLHSHAYHQPVQMVGYSMGGRLALNAFLRAPQMFTRVLLLSTMPFLPQAEHAERARWEAEWSGRFLNEDWATLASAWQEQAVFEGSKSMARRQAPALREMLSVGLKNWSVTRHPFGAAEVKALPASLEWAFGALDQKYMARAKQLQELSVQGQIEIISNAGHRLLADAPEWISQWITRGA